MICEEELNNFYNMVCDCGHEHRRHEDLDVFDFGSGKCTLCRCEFFDNQYLRDEKVKRWKYEKSLQVKIKVPFADNLLYIDSGENKTVALSTNPSWEKEQE